MRRLALILISVTALVPAAAASARTVATGGEKPPKPKIEVLDPGEEPRTKLRVDVAEGDEIALSLTLGTAIDQEIDGQSVPATAIPPIRQNIVIRVTDVTGRGRIAYEFEIEELEVVDSEDADPDVVDALEEELASLAGIAGRAISTPAVWCSRQTSTSLKISTPRSRCSSTSSRSRCRTSRPRTRARPSVWARAGP